MPAIFSNAPWKKPAILQWIILSFAALNIIFLGGKRRGFGSYVAQFHKEFSNITLMELNWIGDSYSAMGYMSSGLSISVMLYFNRRYGLFQLIGSLFVLISCVSSSFAPNPHWLFLTHTLLHGIGSSLILSCVGLVINEHFDHNHQYHLLATTLVSGGSIASIIFVSFFAYLIQKYTWRVSFLILGGMYFVVNSSAAIFFRKNSKTKDMKDKKKLFCSCAGITAYQIPLLTLWFIDRIMSTVVTYGLLLNLTDYLHRTQANLLSSTVLTTLFAAGEGSSYLIGAIITAVTKDLLKGKLGCILLVTSIICGASLVGLEFTTSSPIATNILIFIAGLNIGPSITFLFSAGEELTGLPGHMAYPFALAGMGLGMLLSPLLTAKIAETFKYKWFFFLQGCLVFLKAFCLLVIILLLMYYNEYCRDKYLPLDSTSDEEVFLDDKGPEEDSPLIKEKEKQ